MYTYVSAHVVSARPNSQFETKDIATTRINEVFAANRLILLTVTHPAVQDPFVVSLEPLRLTYSQSLDYIQVVLNGLGDTALPVVDFDPSSSIRYAKYSDARRVGYRVELANMGQNYPDNYPEEALMDVVLSRPTYNTDMALLHTHALMSVNGFYHMTATDNTKAYILDGGKSYRVANKNHFGIWSFFDIGAVEKVPLDPLDIVPADPTKNLKDKIRFSVDVDLTGKSVFLVLGGYLVFQQDNIFTQVNDNSFLLDIKNLPHAARIMESDKFIDLSSLELTRPVDDNTTYSVTEIFSDEVLRKYLTLSQSFLVVVDTPSLNVEKMELRETGTYSVFTTVQEPLYPLIIGNGRQIEYWRKQEEGAWALLIGDEFAKNYMALMQPLPSGVINDSLNSNEPVIPQHPLLLAVSNI